MYHLSDTCSKPLDQHFPARTAQREQTLEIFRSLHPVEVSIVIHSTIINQNQRKTDLEMILKL